MTWIQQAWRRFTRAVGVRAALARALRQQRLVNRDLLRRVVEVLAAANSERDQLRKEHAAELAKRDRLIGELRQVLAGEELRADAAEARARDERLKANRAWHRIGGVWRVVDDDSTPPEIAERLRRVLEDPNYQPAGVLADG